MRLFVLITFLLTTFALFTELAAAASCTTMDLGDTAIHSCDNGVGGTTMRFGDTSIHNFSDGSSGTTMDLGDTSITTWNPPLDVEPLDSYDSYSPYLGSPR